MERIPGVQEIAARPVPGHEEDHHRRGREVDKGTAPEFGPPEEIDGQKDHQQEQEGPTHSLESTHQTSRGAQDHRVREARLRPAAQPPRRRGQRRPATDGKGRVDVGGHASGGEGRNLRHQPGREERPVARRPRLAGQIVDGQHAQRPEPERAGVDEPPVAQELVHEEGDRLRSHSRWRREDPAGSPTNVPGPPAPSRAGPERGSRVRPSRRRAEPRPCAVDATTAAVPTPS